jgi:hypothetical protein
MSCKASSIPTIRGIFLTERAGTRRNAVPEVIFRKDASRKGVSGTFFLGIFITNTTPPRPNFGPLFTSRDSFLRKMALSTNVKNLRIRSLIRKYKN